MQNPLERSIRSAVQANTAIGASFARLGTKEHPRGFVIAGYRNARRALAQALQESYPLQASLEVMDSLRASLGGQLRSEFGNMYRFGQDEARRQLGFYGVEIHSSMGLSSQLDSAVEACIAQVDAQVASMRALILTGAEPIQITGDETRAGIVRYSNLLATAAYWTAALVWAGFDWTIGQTQQAERFKKQAVAALDNRTTDCCLRVHGQVQPLGKSFKLTGTPRYADEMDWPAFHGYCRTAGVLYQEEFDLGLTQRMQDGARTILNERADGVFIDRHPADAFA